MAQDAAQWRRDLPGEEKRTGGNLIQQGLKQVIVAAINQGHVNRRRFPGPAPQKDLQIRRL